MAKTKPGADHAKHYDQLLSDLAKFRKAVKDTSNSIDDLESEVKNAQGGHAKSDIAKLIAKKNALAFANLGQASGHFETFRKSMDKLPPD